MANTIAKPAESSDRCRIVRHRFHIPIDRFGAAGPIGLHVLNANLLCKMAVMTQEDRKFRVGSCVMTLRNLPVRRLCGPTPRSPR